MPGQLIYVVDLDTGARTLLSKKHEGRVQWSGDGRYAVLFDGKAKLGLTCSGDNKLLGTSCAIRGSGCLSCGRVCR